MSPRHEPRPPRSAAQRRARATGPAAPDYGQARELEDDLAREWGGQKARDHAAGVEQDREDRADRGQQHQRALALTRQSLADFRTPRTRTR